MAKKMTAKYRGVCASCGRHHIFPGDQIEQMPNGGWRARYCSGPKEATMRPVISYDGYPPAKRRITASQKAAEEIRRLRAMPRDPLHPGGIEDFY